MTDRPESPKVTEIRALFAAAAAHHVPRMDSLKVSSGRRRDDGRERTWARCDTAQPEQALAAWRLVIAKVDELPGWCGLDVDPWIVEVRADALYGVACMQSVLGDKAAALESLDRVVRTGYAKFELMEKDADLEGLRDNPVFAALVAEAKHRVDGLTIKQVEERLGQPREKVEGDGLRVYYYDQVEVYFDKAGVAEWTYLVKKDGVNGK